MKAQATHLVGKRYRLQPEISGSKVVTTAVTRFGSLRSRFTPGLKGPCSLSLSLHLRPRLYYKMGADAGAAKRIKAMKAQTPLHPQITPSPRNPK